MGKQSLTMWFPKPSLVLLLILLCTCDCADKKKSKRKKPKRSEEICSDNNPSCEEWAANGECDNNPGFMLTECRESCEECELTPEEKESKLWYKAVDPQYGVTPMHLAATFGHEDVMQVLLANHANPNPEDSFERTPLSIAEEKGHKKFTRSLESHLAIKGFAEHAYSEEYLEEVRMMDEL